MPKKSQTDYLARSNAYVLANTIRSVWKSRGHAVKVDVQPVPGFPDSWQVRSDLVGGLPAQAQRVAA